MHPLSPLLPALVSAVSIPITAITSTSLDPGSPSFLYSDQHPPLLVGADGSALSGGVRAWSVDSAAEKWDVRTGRTKIAASVYDLAGRDWVVTVSPEDSVFRMVHAAGGQVIDTRRLWGDFGALCVWRADSGVWYAYLFEKMAVQVLMLREGGGKGGVEVVEVHGFTIPIEAEACAVNPAKKTAFFGGADKKIYSFPVAESIAAPTVTVAAEVGDEISGLAVYVGSTEYLFVGLEEQVEVYGPDMSVLGTIEFTGATDVELGGISLYQGNTDKYPSGAIAFAFESDDGTGFGLASLEPVIEGLGLKANTKYDPSQTTCDDCKPRKCPKVKNCTRNGFCSQDGRSCECFSGYTGQNCNRVVCPNDCSGAGHGKCTGGNVCKCNKGWDGADCGTKVVTAKYETDANGGDGDDPAIWIHPTDTSKSRIITTTKSEDGAGLAVFDLKGKLISRIDAGEPNNVDVIYNFPVGNRTVDLAYAACRADNTLCIFEITPSGDLTPIPGGSQPTPENYEVYGSCVYHSRTTQTFHLFVNSKAAEYHQYTLSSTPQGLSTTLVRTFTGGSGGQTEGCVADDENGFLFVGEEPYGLWRYPAEPSAPATGVLVDSVHGHLTPDVEGVALIRGPGDDKGLLVVSCQGVSAYNIYRRAPPHEFVMRVTVGEGTVDGVTNTDGVAAVGTRMGAFEKGVLVVHDDVNRDGGRPSQDGASFKIVDLLEVVGSALTGEVDERWDPRL